MPKPTHYVGRVSGVRVTTREGSGLIDLAVLGTEARLDSVESLAVLRILREAHIRANRKES